MDPETRRRNFLIKGKDGGTSSFMLLPKSISFSSSSFLLDEAMEFYLSQTPEPDIEPNTSSSKGFLASDFDNKFFCKVVSPNVLLSWSQAPDIDSSSGILSSLKREADVAINGFFTFNLELEDREEKKQESVVVKVKPWDYSITFEAARSWFIEATKGDLKSCSLQGLTHWCVGTKGRDIWFFQHFLNECKDIVPRIYHSEMDEKNGVYVLVMENISSNTELLNKANDAPLHWKLSDNEIVVKEIAKFHSKFFGEKGLERVWNVENSKDWLSDKRDVFWSIKDDVKKQAAFICDKRKSDFGISEETKTFLMNLLEDEAYAKILEEAFRAEHTSLCHGDFSPRNACLRKGRQQLCCFDFEICLVGHPLLDLVDFLTQSLDLETSREQWQNYVLLHRKTMLELLEPEEGKNVGDENQYKRMMDLCVIVHLVHCGFLRCIVASSEESPFFMREGKHCFKLLNWMREEGFKP